MKESSPISTPAESQTSGNAKRGVLDEALQKLEGLGSVSSSNPEGEGVDNFKIEKGLDYDQHGEVGLEKGSISKTENSHPTRVVVPGEYVDINNLSHNIEETHDFADPEGSRQFIAPSKESWTKNSRPVDRLLKYEEENDELSDLKHGINLSENELEEINLDPKNVYDLQGRRVGGKFDTHPLDDESEGQGLLKEDSGGGEVLSDDEVVPPPPMPTKKTGATPPPIPKSSGDTPPPLPPEKAAVTPPALPKTKEHIDLVTAYPDHFGDFVEAVKDSPLLSKKTGATPPPLPTSAPMPEMTPMGPPPLPRPSTPAEMPAMTPLPEPIPSTAPGFNPGVPENDNSLLGRIDREHGQTIEAGNNMKLGAEINWLTSAFNKLKIKMGWSKDVVNHAKLNTIDKLTMGMENYTNDNLIIRKKSELARLDRTIQQEANNPTNERVARENVAKIDKSIEEARARGDQNMERTLIEARNGIVENAVKRRVNLQAERQVLAEQLARYNERKISIVDGFIANVEIETEKVRQNTNYHENVANLRTINTETNRMMSIIAETDSQLISLRKALANTKDRVDKAEIKGAIKEYEATIKASKEKLGFYENVGHRLGSFIELTDKRTKRFDDLRDEYVKKRDSSQVKINNGGVLPQTPPASRPAPAPTPTSSTPKSPTTTEPASTKKTTPPAVPKSTTEPAPTKPAVPKSAKEPTPAEPEPAPAPTPEPPSTPKMEKRPEVEQRRVEKLFNLRKTMETFRRVLVTEDESSLVGPVSATTARKLAEALNEIQKDKDFNKNEIDLFKIAGQITVEFLSQMKTDNGVLTKENRKATKDKLSVFKQIAELK
jgi:hypothetical protein